MWWANCIGATGAPFDSYLTLRGVRTLHARMRCMARTLASRPARDASCRCDVLLPGLAITSAARARANAAERFGAMLSFELNGGSRKCVRSCEGLHLLLAGGVARRCREPGRPSGEHDACRHGSSRRAPRRHFRSLLRLSIGIESAMRRSACARAAEGELLGSRNDLRRVEIGTMLDRRSVCGGHFAPLRETVRVNTRRGL